MSVLVNLYIQEKLREEHYIARLNDIAQEHGYEIYPAFGSITIRETKRNNEYARVDYRGLKTKFQINTTSSTYSVSEASDYIRELQSAINLTEQLNEALHHIEEEIYNRYTDEHANNIKPY